MHRLSSILFAASGVLIGGTGAPSHHALSPPDRIVIGPTRLANQIRLPRTVEVTLTAAPASLTLVPGTTSAVYAYNGIVPGPTIELMEGDHVIVHFHNQLQEVSTIHWHGLHIPFVADGSPLHPVESGGQYTYEFTLQPGSAGTYWYHPHPDHVTGHQVAKGLYGALIVRPTTDPLPATIVDRVLVLSDNRFDVDGAHDLPPMQSARGTLDAENGREGDVFFVNGEINPTFSIRAGETQRWRIINASAARVYRLAIPGHTLLHVGSDGGLFERPVEVSEILVANSERVEILVRGTGMPGSRAMLESLPYDRYIPQTRPSNWQETLQLLTLEYSDAPPVAPVAIPDRLRVVPALDPASAMATQVVVLTQGLINGRMMDLDRVDLHSSLGTTEIWEIENLVGMDHPFHLHGFQFQVLDRNGVPEPFPSWKDTINVPKHQAVRIIVHFADYPGRWMFHCHILDHEDMGMMGILEVL